MRVSGFFSDHLPSSQAAQSAFHPLDLVRVTGLLNRHQRVVTGAQMSAAHGRGGQRSEAKRPIYLFICFSLSLPCHLRVGHGGGGGPPGGLRFVSKLQKGSCFQNRRQERSRTETLLHVASAVRSWLRRSRWLCHLDGAYVDRPTPASTCKRLRSLWRCPSRS